jgi:putative transposase
VRKVLTPASSTVQHPSPTAVSFREFVLDAVKEAVEAFVEDEITAALGAPSHERDAARRGYRNGTRERTLVTTSGPTRLDLPRARLFGPGGSTSEFRSSICERYSRRAVDVDEGLVGAYLAGANTRRIKAALAPMVGGTAVSKSSVSRLAARLQKGYDEWASRPLGDRTWPVVFLDAIVVRVRIDDAVERVPVMAALGVDAEGKKELLSISLYSGESRAAWRGFLDGLVRRGIGQPELVVVDGNAGLRGAVALAWPGADVQRCVVHKLRNLESRVPKRLLEELARDFHGFTDAKSAKAARKALERFRAKWAKKCPGVVESLDEAGDELVTYLKYPRAMWKCVRTTNAIERLNEEIRRRLKTQCQLGSPRTPVLLIYGLVESGQIRMRRIDGWQHLSKKSSPARRRAG